MPDKKNRIVLIGRPNTGKSTLFNIILHEKKAITSDIAGTTRDAIEAECEWQNKNFVLVDTAGLKTKTKTSIENNVQIQAEIALKKADVIIFVVDIRTGPTPQEINLAKELRKQDIPIILAINKAEGKKWRDNRSQFDKLGLDQIVISSIQGIGVGDLLDKAVSYLPKSPADIDNKESIIKVGIFGKPNAGKSSLLNAILGKEKVIVSEIPGTTRDAIDIKINYDNDNIIFYDTAGIKRRTKIKEDIERFSIARSLRVIKKIDIALYVLDVNKAITKQDLRILNRLSTLNKGVIIIANKWDLVIDNKGYKFEKEQIEIFLNYYQYYLKFLYWAPIIFISSKTGKNIEDVLPLLKNVNQERNKIIDPESLEEFIRTIYKKYPPPRLKKKNNPKIKKFIQIASNPPIFKVKIKEGDIINIFYVKYIEKELRKEFGFDGTGIKILVSSE